MGVVSRFGTAGNCPVRQSRNLPAKVQSEAVESSSTELPDWIFKKLPGETRLPRPLNPSRAQAIIDENLVQDSFVTSPFEVSKSDPDRPDARHRGTILHKLLQVLPNRSDADIWQTAETYLARQLPHYSPSVRQSMLQAVKNVFEEPGLHGCYDPDSSQGEVALMGTIASKNGPRTVSGQIDRLAVRANDVVILDYKTSAHAPRLSENVPADYITQLSLYRQLVTRLYPQKPVKCMLVWTHAKDGPVVMELEPARLDAAYDQIAQL